MFVDLIQEKAKVYGYVIVYQPLQWRTETKHRSLSDELKYSNSACFTCN
jgi:hypothetical protein